MDYFSDKEYKSIKKFQTIRDNMFKWLIPYLVKFKINANNVTYAGMLSLVFFAITFNTHKFVSISFLFLNVFLDSIDGVLARATNSTTEWGSLLDITSDTLSMIISSLVLMFYNLVNPLIGAYYIIIYVVSIVLIIFRNELGYRPEYAFRPKYIIFILILIYVITNVETFNSVMILFSVVLTLFAITDFSSIKNKLNKISEVEK